MCLSITKESNKKENNCVLIVPHISRGGGRLSAFSLKPEEEIKMYCPWSSFDTKCSGAQPSELISVSNSTRGSSPYKNVVKRSWA